MSIATQVDELATLLRAGQLLARDVPLQQSVSEALLVFCTLMGAEAAEAVVRSAPGDVPLAIVGTPSLDAHAVTAPLRTRDLLLGELTIRRKTPFELAEEQACLVFADALATAVLASGLADQLAAVEAGLAEMGTAGVADVEQERAALADELHDDAIQAMVAARYAVDRAERGSPEDQPGHLTDARAAIQHAIVETREAMWSLRPRVTRGQLIEALYALSARLADGGGPRIVVRADAVPARMATTAATLAYRLVQEAAGCAARIGGATRVEVRVTMRLGVLEVFISDDGSGYVSAAAPGGQLARWLDRVDRLGGYVRLGDGFAGGTTLAIEFPNALERGDPLP